MYSDGASHRCWRAGLGGRPRHRSRYHFPTNGDALKYGSEAGEKSQKGVTFDGVFQHEEVDTRSDR